MLNVAWPEEDVGLVWPDPAGELGPTEWPLLFDKGKGAEVRLTDPGPVSALVVGPAVGTAPFVEVFVTEVGVAPNDEPVAPGLTTPLLGNGKPVDPEGNRVELVSGKGVVGRPPGVGLEGGAVCPPGPGLDVPLDAAVVCDVFDVSKEVPWLPEPKLWPPVGPVPGSVKLEVGKGGEDPGKALELLGRPLAF